MVSANVSRPNLAFPVLPQDRGGKSQSLDFVRTLLTIDCALFVFGAQRLRNDTSVVLLTEYTNAAARRICRSESLRLDDIDRNPYFREMSQPIQELVLHGIPFETEIQVPVKQGNSKRFVRSGQAIGSRIVISIRECVSAAPAPVARISPKAITLPSPARPQVLVADDTKSNRDRVAELLTRQGFDPILCGDGESALDALTNLPIALALLDICMPGLSGIETARRFRESEFGATSTIPLIATSSAKIPNAREACLIAGMDDHITVPLEERTLLRKMRMLGVASL